MFDANAEDNTPGSPSTCPHRLHWPGRGDHPSIGDATCRTTRFSDAELETLVEDLAIIVRREYDCWVEACW